MAIVALLKAPSIHKFQIVRRALSHDLTTALRPFYFAVHPDLFGQHPEQRQTNENSLKLLSAHLEALYQHSYLNEDAKVLKFYVREGTSTKKRDSFKLVQIRMDKETRDPQRFIQNLLESCNLSTDYIKTVKPAMKQKPQESMATRPSQDYHYNMEFAEFERRVQNVNKFVLNIYIIS